MNKNSQTKKKILISACLAGEKVRYDGGHNQILDINFSELTEKYELIHICPEVLGGLSIPRKPCELNQSNNHIFDSDGTDCTGAFVKGAKYASELAQNEQVVAALMKESSPSCGVRKIYDGTFSKTKVDGQGLTTQYLENNHISCFSENEIDQLIAHLEGDLKP